MTYQRQLFGEDVVSEAGSELLQKVGSADVAMHVERHLPGGHLLPLGDDVIPLQRRLPAPELLAGDGSGDSEREVGGEVAVGEGVGPREGLLPAPLFTGELDLEFRRIEGGGRA